MIRVGAEEDNHDAERDAFPGDEHAARHPVPGDEEGRHPNVHLLQRAADEEPEFAGVARAELPQEQSPVAGVDEDRAARGRNREKTDVEGEACGGHERGQRRRAVVAEEAEMGRRPGETRRSGAGDDATPAATHRGAADDVARGRQPLKDLQEHVVGQCCRRRGGGLALSRRLHLHRRARALAGRGVETARRRPGALATDVGGGRHEARALGALAVGTVWRRPGALAGDVGGGRRGARARARASPGIETVRRRAGALAADDDGGHHGDTQWRGEAGRGSRKNRIGIRAQCHGAAG